MGHRLQQFTSEGAKAIVSKLKSSSAPRPRVTIVRAEPRSFVITWRFVETTDCAFRKICTFNAEETWNFLVL